MSGFTKQAIKKSFIKLLNQKQVNQITVKDIVEDCGINRNSFYYHYSDMPSMIEEIVLDEINEFIRRYPTIDSLEECLNATISFVLENKRAAVHLYHSSNRDLFEQYLWKVSEHAVNTYISTACATYHIEEYDRSVIVRLYTWECFGASIDLLSRGMKDDIQAVFSRIAQLRKGVLEETIQRSNKLQNLSDF